MAVACFFVTVQPGRRNQGSEQIAPGWRRHKYELVYPRRHQGGNSLVVSFCFVGPNVLYVDDVKQLVGGMSVEVIGLGEVANSQLTATSSLVRLLLV